MFVSTKHAEIRLRQRGIPPPVVEWLVSYGSSRFDHQQGQTGRPESGDGSHDEAGNGELSTRNPSCSLRVVSANA
jgi:hypothetical protein